MRVLCYFSLPVFPVTRAEGDVSLTQASCSVSPVQVLGSWGGDPAKLRKQFQLPGGIYPLSLAGEFSLWGAEMSISLSVGVANKYGMLPVSYPSAGRWNTDRFMWVAREPILFL